MPDTTPKTIFEAAVPMTAGATSNIAGGRLPGPIMADATIHRDSPLWEVAAERERQNVKWGEQNHPDGTGSPGHELHARLARYECKRRTAEGTVTWRDILDEEVAEAYAEDDPANLRAELIQVAAVACAWVEALDRRKAVK